LYTKKEQESIDMRPDDPRDTGPVVPQRQLLRPLNERPSTTTSQAAAAIVRNQIDTIYTAQTAGPTQDENPYERTHTSTNAHIQAAQWATYHSAWQDYYQKYYERYYVGQVYQARQALEARAREAATDASASFKPQEVVPDSDTSETLSRQEALNELRTSLREKVQTSATTIRKSRHFVPITAAGCVILLFLFLQYNRILFANVEAYVSPGNIDPANLIIDPSTDVTVSPDPKLIIPKINVDVPVLYDTRPDYDSQMKAMQNGVAWFGIPGADSKPGQVGNTVLSGHSSNDVIDQGSYKFIFARLDHLEKGDTIYVNYHSKRYTYTVTSKTVVQPTDVGRLVYPTTKPMLTLITCTPLGTSLNRLLVTAEQVSPDPKVAAKAPAPTTSTQPTSIPGNSPTFLQRIFGGGTN
jgi:sortase A